MSCAACNGTGFVDYQQGPSRFVARCRCFSGRRLSKTIRSIDDVFPEAVVTKEWFPHGIDPAADSVPFTFYDEAGIPPACRAWTLLTSPSPRAVVVKAQQWFDARSDLVLFGPNGTGKTGLAIAILHEAMARGERCIFANVAAWMLRVQASFSQTAVSELDVIRPFVDAEVLVLDDLNARRTTGHYADTLLLVANERLAASRPTIYTTNLSPEELADTYSPAFYDRLRASAQWWELSGASIRQPWAPPTDQETP